MGKQFTTILENIEVYIVKPSFENSKRNNWKSSPKSQALQVTVVLLIYQTFITIN